MQLEHLFECRFAGPLIAAITENYTKTDATTQEALVLLDRIVNNKANLTWVPESLNTFKNNYFGGELSDAVLVIDTDLMPKNKIKVESLPRTMRIIWHLQIIWIRRGTSLGV